MKLINSTAIVLAAVAAPAAAQYGSMSPPQPTTRPQTTQEPAPAPAAATSATPSVKPSNKALKAIVDLQTAVNKNDTANIPAKVAAAQAVATTKEDRYLIAQFQLKVAANANDAAAASTAIDAIAASGVLDNSHVAAFYRGLGGTYFKANQFPQAAAAFQHAISLDPRDPDAMMALAESQNGVGQKAEAVTTFQGAIQLSLAGGKKPEEGVYRRALSIAYEAKLPSSVEMGQEWLAAYPGPDSWHNSIAIYRNVDHPDASATFDLLRLSRATSSMVGTSDYYNYASEAANQANYGEARAVIAEGIAAGKIKATDAGISDVEAALKGKPTPTAAELVTAEKGAAIPNAFIRVGDRYYGLGNYQKAAELYRTGLAKGADANLGNLRLGEALARSGDKPGATAALSKVGGSLAPVAKFWTVYVQH
jgi:tetratricopeptide (TPR) repeat protein